MKKTLVFTAFMGAFIYSASAQPLVQLSPQFLPSDSFQFNSQVHSQSQAKKQGDWFNFIDASDANNGGAISYTIYTNNALFPDSSVKQSYGDGNGGTTLDKTALYNVGQVFDPKSFYFTNLLNESTPYEVDSIAFAYRYSHVVPGSVDTLEFQVFYDNSVILGTLLGAPPEPTAWIKYDQNNENGFLAKETWQITLDGTDTAWAGFQTKTIALPSKATIKANGIIAIAYRFIPGYSYNEGDTLDQTWSNPEVQNKINQFQPLIAVDLGKTDEDSYNHGLSMRYSNKYAKAGWDEEFIPGDAWQDYTEYVYISFKVMALTSVQNPIQSGNTRVYPNPSMGSESVNIAFTLTENTNVSIEVYDLLGNKVQTVMNGNVEAGEQIATLDATLLNAGIYVYRMKAGEQVITGKMSIVK